MLRGFLFHCSILSKVGASEKTGAVQTVLTLDLGEVVNTDDGSFQVCVAEELEAVFLRGHDSAFRALRDTLTRYFEAKDNPH